MARTKKIANAEEIKPKKPKTTVIKTRCEERLCFTCGNMEVISRWEDVEYYCKPLRGWLRVDFMPKGGCSHWIEIDKEQ